MGDVSLENFNNPQCSTLYRMQLEAVNASCDCIKNCVVGAC